MVKIKSQQQQQKTSAKKDSILTETTIIGIN